jgi:signal peptidase I
VSRGPGRPIAGGWLTATLAAVGVAVLLPLAVFLTSAWLLGWQLQSVLSGSMQPTYPVGSLLVVGSVDPATIEVGSPIVFRDPAHPDRIVTHRVVAQSPGSTLSFLTKGDANAANDAFPVTADQIVGRPLWSVSHLGNVLEWLAWPRSLVLIVIPAILLFIDDRRGRKRALAPEAALRPAAG